MSLRILMGTKKPDPSTLDTLKMITAVTKLTNAMKEIRALMPKDVVMGGNEHEARHNKPITEIIFAISLLLRDLIDDVLESKT